jgi:Txe/YoeB family toxin of Txe-Axe toxin-antitoxin module
MPWGVVYYKTTEGDAPGWSFLNDCPTKTRAKILAVLEAVRAAPPPAFSGGGMWEAMSGSMGGYYEIRVTGPPNRSHYRLFCILDNGSEDHLAACGFDGPKIAVINGLVKKNATLFTDAIYRSQVRDLGDDYLATWPRRIAC